MSRVPDPARSRAVLIGASRYGALPDIPAVRANLTGLEAALAVGKCTVVPEPATVKDIGDAIVAAAGEATDLLFVYYAGHGLLDDAGRLHLALTTSDPDRVRWTAVPFDVIREEMVKGPAAARVLVLDCCFSGRVIEAMAGEKAVISGQVDISGTYTLTSTSANALSHAPKGATHTAFTGAILAVAGTAGPLTLDDLFRQVDHHLATRGLPRPQRRVVNTAGELVLFKATSVPEGPRPGRKRATEELRARRKRAGDIAGWLVAAALIVAGGVATANVLLYDQYAADAEVGDCVYVKEPQNTLGMKLQPCSQPWRTDGQGYEVLARVNADPREFSLTEFCAGEIPGWELVPGSGRWLPPEEGGQWTGLCLKPLD